MLKTGHLMHFSTSFFTLRPIVKRPVVTHQAHYTVAVSGAASDAVTMNQRAAEKQQVRRRN